MHRMHDRVDSGHERREFNWVASTEGEAYDVVTLPGSMKSVSAMRSLSKLPLAAQPRSTFLLPLLYCFYASEYYSAILNSEEVVLIGFTEFSRLPSSSRYRISSNFRSLSLLFPSETLAAYAKLNRVGILSDTEGPSLLPNSSATVGCWGKENGGIDPTACRCSAVEFFPHFPPIIICSLDREWQSSANHHFGIVENQTVNKRMGTTTSSNKFIELTNSRWWTSKNGFISRICRIGKLHLNISQRYISTARLTVQLRAYPFNNLCYYSIGA